jgi:hypothetical protein
MLIKYVSESDPKIPKEHPLLLALNQSIKYSSKRQPISKLQFKPKVSKTSLLPSLPLPSSIIHFFPLVYSPLLYSQTSCTFPLVLSCPCP